MLSKQLLDFARYALAYFFFAFSIWVFVHTWRKGHRILPFVMIGLFCIPSLFEGTIKAHMEWDKMSLETKDLVNYAMGYSILVLVFLAAKLYRPNWSCTPLLSSFLVGMFGSKLVGAAKRRDDHSFISTQWIIILFLPIAPIQSYRVVGGSEVSQWSGPTVTITRDYAIVEYLKLYFPQLLIVWSWYVAWGIVFILLNSKVFIIPVIGYILGGSLLIAAFILFKSGE